MSRRSLLTIADLDRAEIARILRVGNRFAEVMERDIKKVPTLRGRTVINMFFEASTRTSTSFELAGKRLSADVVNVKGSGSSVEKGETLKDTVITLNSYLPDVLVIRHQSVGACHDAVQQRSAVSAFVEDVGAVVAGQLGRLDQEVRPSFVVGVVGEVEAVSEECATECQIALRVRADRVEFDTEGDRGQGVDPVRLRGRQVVGAEQTIAEPGEALAKLAFVEAVAPGFCDRSERSRRSGSTDDRARPGRL